MASSAAWAASSRFWLPNRPRISGRASKLSPVTCMSMTLSVTLTLAAKRFSSESFISVKLAERRPWRFGRQQHAALDRQVLALDLEVLDARTLLALGIEGHLGGGLGHGRAHPADLLDAHLGIAEVGREVDPALRVREVVDGGGDGDRAADEGAEVDPQRAALLAVERGLDHGRLQEVRRRAALPRDLGGNAGDLGGALGGEHALVHDEFDLALGDVDAGQRILQRGVHRAWRRPSPRCAPAAAA